MIALTRIDMIDRAAVAVDCRRAATPFRWTMEPVGAAIAVQVSDDDRPGPADWFAHNADNWGPGTARTVCEDAPVGWLRFSTVLDAAATVRIAHTGTIYCHKSANDPLTAGAAIAAVDMVVGEDVDRYLPAAFSYGGPFGSLDYSAASDDGTVATAEVDGDSLMVSGIATGSATITVTATAPHGGQAKATIAVTVS